MRALKSPAITIAVGTAEYRHGVDCCCASAFKAMYIARHDQALRLILKSIANGDHGGYYKIADIRRAELIEDMGVSAKRIPSCLIHAWRGQT